jgi:hypothetical protein
MQNQTQLGSDVLGNQNESEKPMTTDSASSPVTALTVGAKNEHSKLVSLLALAAGAAAMPQTSNADIIYTDQSATVSWDGLRSFTIPNLPGNAQLGFTANRSGALPSTWVRSVTGGRRGSGYVQILNVLVSQPLLWDQIKASPFNGNPVANNKFASAQAAFHAPNNYGGRYLAFEFKDSSVTGTPLRYGWVGLGLVNGNLSGGGNYPALTISGWAYDNTGAQIPMGVPEPGSVSLLALGALTLGAVGVRSWRRNRAAACQS